MSAPDDERAPDDGRAEAIETWARRAAKRAPKRAPKGALAKTGAIYASALRRAASVTRRQAG